MKFRMLVFSVLSILSRPSRGAWIEIKLMLERFGIWVEVAPLAGRVD